MKTKGFERLAAGAMAVLWSCFVPCLGIAQTAKLKENKKVVGTYVGAIGEHFAITGTGSYRLFAGLFSFAMYFNPAGYHEAISRVGVVFQGGRKHSLDFRVVNVGTPVPPANNPSDNLEFWAELPNASAIRPSIVALDYSATLNAGEVTGQLLPGKMTHSSNNLDAQTTYSTSSGLVSQTYPNVRIEVDRVYEKVALTSRATRAKVRR